MANLTPEQIVEKQIRNATNATEDFRTGVKQTKKNPMQRAIQAIPKMRANILAAIDNGTVEAGLASVSQQDWVNATAGKGGDRYAAGIEAAKPTLLDFQRQMKPYRDQVKEQIDQMPSTTPEQRIQRMLQNVQLMRQFKFQKRK